MERAEKLNMEKLEQVTGGNYGGSSGNIFVPCGEYITVDKGRAQGVYVIAFYNDQEGWVDSRGLEWL